MDLDLFIKYKLNPAIATAFIISGYCNSKQVSKLCDTGKMKTAIVEIEKKVMALVANRQELLSADFLLLYDSQLPMKVLSNASAMTFACRGNFKFRAMEREEIDLFVRHCVQIEAKHDVQIETRIDTVKIETKGDFIPHMENQHSGHAKASVQSEEKKLNIKEVDFQLFINSRVQLVVAIGLILCGYIDQESVAKLVDEQEKEKAILALEEKIPQLYFNRAEVLELETWNEAIPRGLFKKIVQNAALVTFGRRNNFKLNEREKDQLTSFIRRCSFREANEPVRERLETTINSYIKDNFSNVDKVIVNWDDENQAFAICPCCSERHILSVTPAGSISTGNFYQHMRTSHSHLLNHEKPNSAQGPQNQDLQGQDPPSSKNANGKKSKNKRRKKH